MAQSFQIELVKVPKPVPVILESDEEGEYDTIFRKCNPRPVEALPSPPVGQRVLAALRTTGAAVIRAGRCMARIPKAILAVASAIVIIILVGLVIWAFANLGQPERQEEATILDISEVDDGEEEAGVKDQGSMADIVAILERLPFFN